MQSIPKGVFRLAACLSEEVVRRRATSHRDNPQRLSRSLRQGVNSFQDFLGNVLRNRSIQRPAGQADEKSRDAPSTPNQPISLLGAGRVAQDFIQQDICLAGSQGLQLQPV
ncbi:MAG TPA: hypothetical protein VIU62_14455, partial [Chloroflexota bacterium]